MAVAGRPPGRVRPRCERFRRIIGGRKERGAPERLGRPLVGLWTRVRGRAGTAHVKQTCMCAKSRFGRARPRLRMSLYGLWLYHLLRGARAGPEPEAVTGATPLFRCPVWHLGELGYALHPTRPRGSLRVHQSFAGRPFGPPGGVRLSGEPGTLQDARWKRTLTTRCTSSSSRVVASITDSLIHGTNPGLTRLGQRYRATSVEPS